MIIPCPVDGFTEQTADNKPVYFLDVPDEWLGKHLSVRDTAVTGLANGEAAGMPIEFKTFAISLALADNWNLPGVTGKMESVDFNMLNLSIMAWVNYTVWGSFNRCFNVPKNSSPPLPNG